MLQETTRRRILQVAGGSLLISSIGIPASAQDDEEAIEPETEIFLEGANDGWIGVEPDSITDEENPTLVLTAGDSYEITFENIDGSNHNLEIVDGDDDVVDEYETETTDEEGDTETLEIEEITDGMAEYVCRHHDETMRGEIEVQ
ncbi:blue (type 1) copper domain-containing protein [Natronococcus amylolyticus DSM 10524]|uniref:Blue (Type 1) copper domain-containing protein n=1 Tax=Natronococcus amylolyticus DSM 10524 TaxID=1227497 RepID=L9X7D7_9EURY|nr:plastocyanin/azurin family copper-binding protein [Natronococcus amylolyticus]ELY56523.1 blue (type 1) copper domain-containing protein [Natronococcus amylolyticus DSM 10524]